MVQDGFIKPDELLTVANWGGNIEMECVLPARQILGLTRTPRFHSYDHSVYWPALLKLCGDRHARELDEWRKLGSKIGTSEWEVKTRAHGGQGQAAKVTPATVETPSNAEKVVQDAEVTAAAVTPADVAVAQ